VAPEETGRRRPPLIERVRARQERHRQRSRIIRIPFAVAGFVVLLLGIVMLFTPGPGWAAIVFGLGLLALEFTWAERALERIINRVEQASDQVRTGSPLRRAFVLSLGVIATAALITLIVLWDIPLFPG
jgi:uncharacterized protein (TIGR02611 family)